MLAELATRLRASRAAGGGEGLGAELEGEEGAEEGPVRLVLGEECSVM